MLSVAVYSDDIFVAEFECQAVASLHAASKPQVMRQLEHARPGLPCTSYGTIRRTVVDHQYRHARHHRLDLANNPAHGPLLVEGGNQNQQAPNRHNVATRLNEIECWASNA